MYTHVNRHVHLVSKRSPAKVTFVRPFSCVSPKMRLQLLVLGKTSLTMRTFVGPLSRVCVNMLLQAALKRKSFGAKSTLVRAFATVRPVVADEISAECKFFLADVAVEHFIAVEHHVRPKGVF